MIDDLDLRKAIEMAISTEQLGAYFYLRMERKFSEHPQLHDIFRQLVKDEKDHEQQFGKILKQVPPEEGQARHYELYQYLRATAISEFFREDAFKDTDDIKSPTEALGRALAFEKSTLQFYQAIRDVLGDSPELDAIINVEKTHVVSLMRVITTEGKFRGLGDKE